MSADGRGKSNFGIILVLFILLAIIFSGRYGGMYY